MAQDVRLLRMSYDGSPLLLVGEKDDGEVDAVSVTVGDPEKLIRDLMAVLPEWRKAKYAKAQEDLQDAQSRLIKFGG